MPNYTMLIISNIVRNLKNYLLLLSTIKIIYVDNIIDAGLRQGGALSPVLYLISPWKK